MCGKFTAQLTWEEYCDLAEVPSDGGQGGPPPMDPQLVLQTFTPMSRVPVLHLGPVRQRRLTLMRWGWYNHKLSDTTRGFSHLHARSEEIDRTPTWIESFFDRRGVIFTKTFNIGEELPDGKIKQWVCSRADGRPMALAVIYDSRDLVQGRLVYFAMVTTQSCPPLDMRDSRMPAVLELEEVAAWIGETGLGGAGLKSLLRSYPGSLVMREQEGRRAKRAAPEPGQAELF
jgi:putative SOS response-associated peptidase YedK